MTSLPEVLILGRPNVGKSTLINRICKNASAITLDQPGITRDIVPFLCRWKGRVFHLLDSGGIMTVKSKDMVLQEAIEMRVKKAMQTADVIVFLLDHPIHPLDQNIATLLRPFQKKVMLVVNKIDADHQKGVLSEFYQLGLGEPLGISSHHGHGVLPLLDKIAKRLPSVVLDEKLQRKVTFIGRPNVGKSSLLNAILREDRVMVSEIAGTTRDPVCAYYDTPQFKLVLTDTAGLRRQSKIEDGVEYYSALRTKAALEEADIVTLILEPTIFSNQDKVLIRHVLTNHKKMVVFINKSDTISDEEKKEIQEKLIADMPQLTYYPFVFGSALKRKNLSKLLQQLTHVLEKQELRVNTSLFNQFMSRVITRTLPQSAGSLKIYYATQTEVNPPMFVFVVNHMKRVTDAIQRFIESKIRDHFSGFLGMPIILKFKEKTQDEDRKERILAERKKMSTPDTSKSKFSKPAFQKKRTEKRTEKITDKKKLLKPSSFKKKR